MVNVSKMAAENLAGVCETTNKHWMKSLNIYRGIHFHDNSQKSHQNVSPQFHFFYFFFFFLNKKKPLLFFNFNQQEE